MLRNALLTLVCCVTFALPVAADTAYIDVSGQGEIKAWPDYLTLSVELSDTQQELSKAKDSVDEAFATLSRVARRLDVDQDDIESILINNYPQYSYDRDGKRQFEGHRVVRPVTINLRNLKNYGELLEAVMVDERFRVTSTGLRFNEPEEHRSKARRLALLNARTKAEEMAGTLGQKITGVLWIQENGGSFPEPVFQAEGAMLMRAKVADSGSAMQIQKQTVEQQVQVRFAMTEGKVSDE